MNKLSLTKLSKNEIERQSSVFRENTELAIYYCIECDTEFVDQVDTPIEHCRKYENVRELFSLGKYKGNHYEV